MKRIIILTALLLMSVVGAVAQTSAERWEVGNKAYIEGNYDKAIEEYTAILDGGEYSMKLYYNLANAYFKTGAMGKAILYYNKALRIAPSQEDIRHNLALAEAQTKDRIAVIPEFFLNRWLRTMRNSMSCTEWSVLSLVWLGVLLAFVVLFLLASHVRWRKMGFYGALCAFVLFVATTSFAVSSRNDMLSHSEAIVMGTAISVKSSPDRSATDLFVLHEGTKVKVLTEVDEWVEVVIADGKKGWTERKNIEEI
ncbi:MAG: tetratricopeptide repeat protein [Rikenellaceae bacterium]|nr:tetratricopeptide repeat protein [Rikenellaceae bacterium]